MPLITSAQVVALAYLPAIDPALILIDVIKAAEARYIVPVLTLPLYNDVIANPGKYTTLITDYIMPCLAFYVKYINYNQQPETYVDISTISTELRHDVLRDIFSVARVKEKLMNSYIVSQDYSLYVPPKSRRVNGFIVPNSAT